MAFSFRYFIIQGANSIYCMLRQRFPLVENGQILLKSWLKNGSLRDQVSAMVVIVGGARIMEISRSQEFLTNGQARPSLRLRAKRWMSISDGWR